MRLNNYNYNNKAPSGNRNGLSINPGYLIFFIIILLVFIFVLVLFLGIKNGNGKDVAEGMTEERAERVSETEDEPVKYEGYSEQIHSIFSDAYGYNYTLDILQSEDNAYFLDGIMKEVMEGTSYQIYGTLIEKGIEGRIETLSGAREDFAFTSKNSFLTAAVFNYLDTLPEDDRRKDEKGFEDYVDLGYAVSGYEIMSDIEDTLLNSKYEVEAEEGGTYKVSYPSGSLKADTGRMFFDRLFNDYPGDLTITVNVKDEDGARLVSIEGSGKVNFSLSMRELRNIGELDTSQLDSAYNYDKNNQSPFARKIDHLSYQEYIDKYSK